VRHCSVGRCWFIYLSHDIGKLDRLHAALATQSSSAFRTEPKAVCESSLEVRGIDR
jgi:hypothetical protein